jgi:hypothetical protein
VKSRKLHPGAATKQVKDPENIRLTLGDFADIIVDTSEHIPIYHWIVQKVGSAAIVRWSQEQTFEEAKSVALSYLQIVSGQEQTRYTLKGPSGERAWEKSSWRPI